MGKGGKKSFDRAYLTKVRYCKGKVVFDKITAQTAANQRFAEDHIRLRIYPCHGHWHLTSKL